MEDDSEQDNLIEDDYYAFMNVPRNASNEEIISAYRRLSKLYHPDKHPNPDHKKEAEILFNRTRRAYEEFTAQNALNIEEIGVGTFGGFVEYGAEKKVSNYTSLSTAVRVGVPTGVSLRIRLSRGSQSYTFPIHLCDEIFPAPVFYATVAPLITWTIIKKFIIDPVVKEQKERSKEKQREINKSMMLEKQKEAKAAIELMKATFSRIRSEEEHRGGIVITKALYGRLVYPQDRVLGEDPTIGLRDEVIDVTIPLQCLVNESKLVLHNATKSQLPGFFDPCVGEDKQLLVQYLFHAQIHECIIKDNEPLRIPKQSHRVNTT
ncbi:dnaJ homolog subfamily C member 11-like [Belonocnema kinseyi]|uniref:dnaJ homolog subfamily C member 11-like n=1 Tax=Belonocnema kinseyi TaxID=2817044 RepID=UPI00143CD8E5|nr:dnaJ homolog subfamily C member 11-like [Belonocnema kinseyi]